MKKQVLLLIALVVVFVPTIASADQVNFSMLVGQTEYLTVLPYASGENNGSYYVGLTEGVLSTTSDDITSSIGSFWMFCVDPLHDISVPTTYQVMVENLNSPTVSNSMGVTIAQLQEQANLGLNFGTAPSNSIADSTFQEAIWDIPGGINGVLYSSSDVVNALATAEAIYRSQDYSNSYFLDPVGPEQAFMPVTTPPAVPESSSLFLSSMGCLCMIGCFFSKKMKTVRT